jgi:DNA-binding NarL/FixJ family response regulator
MPGAHRPPTAKTRRARVLAVDDQTPFLAVLRDLVHATRELAPLAETHSGERAIQAVQEIEPDVVLMDVWMPGMGGIAAAREIKARRPSTLVILISTMHPDEIPLEADDTCADAVVWKSELAPRLLDEIWLRYRGQRSSPVPS